MPAIADFLPSHTIVRIEMSINSAELKQQINKRLSLNLLIQGAAAYTFLSGSHLVKDQLEAIKPGLTKRYDRFAISGLLNYCCGDIALMFGRPNRWYGFSSQPQRPFAGHRFLGKHLNGLARESTRMLFRMAWGKLWCPLPVLSHFEMMTLVIRLMYHDQKHARELERLARIAVAEIWDVPMDRLTATLTTDVAFGRIPTPKTTSGKMIQQGVIGYGGVERRDGSFQVIARATIFPLLVHELVKGTMELICLHGLADLDELTYAAVVAEADQLEYESWFLQGGAAMWKRFIALAPRDKPLSQTVMAVARLEPDELDDLLIDVIEHPHRAQRFLAEY